MEQIIELQESSDVVNLAIDIQKITSRKNREGFKLTDVSIIGSSFTGYIKAILVFTKE